METDLNMLDAMRKGATLQGFFVRLRDKECFFQTKSKRKSIQLAQRVLRRVDLPENATTCREVCYWGHFARCTVRTSPCGREYYDISGDFIGGRGTFVDDGETVLFDLTTL